MEKYGTGRVNKRKCKWHTGGREYGGGRGERCATFFPNDFLHCRKRF